jgi:tetratricopeptide (TPR) repeat protein
MQNIENAQRQLPEECRDLEAQARLWLAKGCELERVPDWEGAVEAYNHALAADPGDPLVRYFANNNLGYSLIQVGRFDEAEEYCEAAILICPEQYNAHKNLGLAREGQGRWLDAALSLVEAARLFPQNTRAWLHLQKLISLKPWLLEHAPDLARDVAAIEACYQAHGGIPKLN